MFRGKHFYNLTMYLNYVSLIFKNVFMNMTKNFLVTVSAFHPFLVSSRSVKIGLNS